MKLFIPGKEDSNTFFEEIMTFSKIKYEFGHFSIFNPKLHDAILIQWPEMIFNWHEPTKKELEDIITELTQWSAKTTIYYIVHNVERHLGHTQLFESLYDTVELQSHTFLHFGKYSYNYFKKKYPKKDHHIIHHPLYEKTFKIFNKAQARKKLDIDQDELVIIAPGKLRKKEESRLLLKSFKNIKEEKKMLLVPSMYKYTLPENFPGRYRIKQFIDIDKIYKNLVNFFYPKPRFNFGYQYVPPERLALMMAAADIVFITRKESLNSGILYLGLTFRKIIVGPAIGNIKEVLDEFSFPAFNPFSEKSITSALISGINMHKKSTYEYNEDLLLQFQPKNIAKKLDDLILNKYLIKGD